MSPLNIKELDFLDLPSNLNKFFNYSFPSIRIVLILLLAILQNSNQYSN